jgi:hypothetical protein
MAARHECSIIQSISSKKFETLDLKTSIKKENIEEVTFYQNFKTEE